MNLKLPLRILLLAALAASSAIGQNPTASAPEAATTTTPQLDVISVKPNKRSAGMRRLLFIADGISAANVTVHMLLTSGYGLNDDQVVGEPAWAKTDGFDIEAKVAGPDVATLSKLSFEQRRSLFQQVLTDRFQLVAHHETKELPVYALVVIKGGPKLHESKPPDSTPSADGLPRGPTGMVSRGKATAQEADIAWLMTFLSRQLGRTIVDRTGLTGKYDITLQWIADDGAAPQARTSDAAQSATSPPPDSGPSIFTAIQEQLGLKLESTKGPVRVLVIDHIEKPAEN